MSKEAINRIWEGVWSKENGDFGYLVESTFAKEAYASLERLGVPKTGRFLEAGCGTGRLSAMVARAYPNLRVEGLDQSKSSLSIGNSLKATLELGNLEFRNGDLFHLPYPDGHFDAVFSEGVIQHFESGGDPSQEDAVREMIRVLSPGGALIASTVNWHCYPHTLYKWWLKVRDIDYEYGFEQSFSKAELGRMFAANGLSDVRSTGYFPSYGFHRLHYLYGLKIFRWCARLVEILNSPWIAKQFGFEIMVKATKPRCI